MGWPRENKSVTRATYYRVSLEGSESAICFHRTPLDLVAKATRFVPRAGLLCPYREALGGISSSTGSQLQGPFRALVVYHLRRLTFALPLTLYAIITECCVLDHTGSKYPLDHSKLGYAIQDA